MQEATRSNCLKTIALPILIHSLLFKASAEHVLLKMLNSEPLHPACLRLKTLKKPSLFRYTSLQFKPNKGVQGKRTTFSGERGSVSLMCSKGEGRCPKGER